LSRPATEWIILISSARRAVLNNSTYRHLYQFALATSEKPAVLVAKIQRDATTSASDKLARSEEIYCEVAARKRHATQFNAAELLGPIVML
jgi:hypothetical protein